MFTSKLGNLPRQVEQTKQFYEFDRDRQQRRVERQLDARGCPLSEASS